MMSRVPPLAQIVSYITDPREGRGRRHPLRAILLLVCTGTMCGCDSLLAISEWGRALPHAVVEEMGFGHRPPCATTLSTVLSRLDVREWERWLGWWFERVMQALSCAQASQCSGSGELREAIAIDGKTQRGSKKQGVPAAHLLTAVSHGLGLTLAQRAVDKKTNEITVFPDVLRDLTLHGRLVTVDAMMTQREPAKMILEQQGDYLMAVKGNQPTLHDDVSTFFEHVDAVMPDAVQVVETVDAGHGRVESRRLTTTTALNGHLDWPGVGQAFMVERWTELQRSGRERRQTVYGVTSLTPEQAPPSLLLHYVRGHWTIENRVFHVRDVTFGEDHSQVRRGTLPQAMSAIRNLVIGLFRICEQTNIRSARRQAAADTGAALQSLIEPPRLLRTG